MEQPSLGLRIAEEKTRQLLKLQYCGVQLSPQCMTSLTIFKWYKLERLHPYKYANVMAEW